MALSHGGLVKLLEECGEASQVAAKLIAYPDTPHPDGTNLRVRLQEEMSDVMAAMNAVADLHGLDIESMRARTKRKYELFIKWSTEE